MKCITCDGEGILPCHLCNGNGAVLQCPECYGTDQLCDLCEGMDVSITGMDCPECDGDGLRACGLCYFGTVPED